MNIKQWFTRKKESVREKLSNIKNKYKRKKEEKKEEKIKVQKDKIAEEKKIIDDYNKALETKLEETIKRLEETEEKNRRLKKKVKYHQDKEKIKIPDTPGEIISDEEPISTPTRTPIRRFFIVDYYITWTETLDDGVKYRGATFHFGKPERFSDLETAYEKFWYHYDRISGLYQSANIIIPEDGFLLIYENDKLLQDFTFPATGDV